MVGQGGLGYPVDKHTNLVGWDNDPVAASDLTARLKRPAMVKPPSLRGARGGGGGYGKNDAVCLG